MNAMQASSLFQKGNKFQFGFTFLPRIELKPATLEFSRPGGKLENTADAINCFKGEILLQ
jgi:hypothetical protein